MSKCSADIGENDHFCVNCGHQLQNREEAETAQVNQSVHVQKSSEMKEAENDSAKRVNLTEEAKSLFATTTESIGKLAGNEERLNVNLKDMFSEVFKVHSKDEVDQIFIAGTKNTTPALDEVSEEWGKPWMFSRVFLAFAVTFLGLWIVVTSFDNDRALPGLIFIGALTVPLSGLIFFFESNAFKNISLLEVLKMFFVGGVFSLISTLILYEFVTFSDEYYFFGIMTPFDAFMVDLVEKLGKALIIIYFINKCKTNKILNGLLIGGAIGAGFEMFETAGYILEFGLDNASFLIDVVFQRAWTAIGSHTLWSAIIGAAIVIAKEQQHFTFNSLLDKRFLIFFFTSVVLHGIWDAYIRALSSFNLKYILLSVVAWIIVFVLMKAGLKQVNVLQEEARQLKSAHPVE